MVMRSSLSLTSLCQSKLFDLYLLCPDPANTVSKAYQKNYFDKTLYKQNAD